MVQGFLASGSPDELPVRLRSALASLAGAIPGVFEIDAREGLLTGLGGDGKVPRDVPPAGGREEAKQVMNEANDLLLEAGLARELP